MFSGPTIDQVLAVSGVYQAASLVHQLASSDSHPENALLDSALSVLKIDPDSVEDAIGGNRPILGCQILARAYGNRSTTVPRSLHRYVKGVLYHADRIPGQKTTVEQIHHGLKELNQQFLPHGVFPREDADAAEYLYQSLSELYERTIGNLSPRIMVESKREKLTDPATTSRIRSALFAGIHYAFLWFQLGGGHLHLIVHRRKYLDMAAGLCRI